MGRAVPPSRLKGARVPLVIVACRMLALKCGGAMHGRERAHFRLVDDLPIADDVNRGIMETQRLDRVRLVEHHQVSRGILQNPKAREVDRGSSIGRDHVVKRLDFLSRRHP